ncbi:transposable element Tc1 transposase [Trichonephila clavipes]|nr:transposable element Tc1 transposase [Trichonephila clavipes]
MSGPANSPDFNPIEHVWDMLGRQIAALLHQPRSVIKLEMSLQEAWNCLSPQLILHVLASIWHDSPGWVLTFSRGLFQASSFPASFLQFLVLKTR